ncbi:MAG TPA: polysaccharide pyruvyl transferase family protein [Thermoanaerobaculia bacterium]|nr:polysaccharide pyruvyl transferase family protein [Thermoanaerobaculia bacterium]
MHPSLVFVADVGGPETRHVGDEAMLEANLTAFRRLLPGLHATVVSPRPWNDSQGVDWLPGPAFAAACDATENERLGLLGRRMAAAERGRSARPGGADSALASALSNAEALVISGGGNLRSRWPEHLYQRAALVRWAQAIGKPVAFLGQTIGPELTAAERELLAPVLREARWVGVRELASLSLALDLGTPPERLDYQLDDAFHLDPRPPTSEEGSRLPPLGDGPWVAVSLHPFDVAGGEVMRAVAGQLAAFAGATRTRLVFVPHEATNGGGDERFARELTAHLPAGVESRVCPVLPAGVVRWLTGQASLVLASRYHALVFGLASCVPCLGVYEDEYTRIKLHGALAQASQESRWCLPLAGAGEGALAARALELWDCRDAVRSALEERRPARRQQEARRWPRLLAALGLESRVEPDCAAVEIDGNLVGRPPRAMALALAAALQQRDAAARVEVERLQAESARLRAELQWVTGTTTWRLRERLVRVRPLAAAFRAIRRRRWPRAERG